MYCVHGCLSQRIRFVSDASIQHQGFRATLEAVPQISSKYATLLAAMSCRQQVEHLVPESAKAWDLRVVFLCFLQANVAGISTFKKAKLEASSHLGFRDFIPKMQVVPGKSLDPLKRDLLYVKQCTVRLHGCSIDDSGKDEGSGPRAKKIYGISFMNKVILKEDKQNFSTTELGTNGAERQ